jgi:hydrophobic/amphiphilic exporter-1 (mainly G- bacteria), HAE1 family
VPAIQRIEGVGSVTISGGQTRQINVLMDLDRISAYQILPSQISASIRNANTNLGLGSVDTGDQSISLRAPSQITSAEDIAKLPITGTRYSVGDVATVVDGVKDSSSHERLNGLDAVSINVVKQAKANTVAVSNAAHAELDRLFALHPELKYIITLDQSVQVSRSVSSSLEEMVMAVLAALLVVLFFFRDLRNTLVTMAGLPVIMILSFGALAMFGITINIISLLALSLSVGLVIDDAIVVRENIFRYMERGFNARQAASRATAEVSLSVLAMTLTVVAVFLPVAMTSGITGFIFKAFGLTVASAMLISLVEAFTFAPMLSANLFGSQRVIRHGQQVQADAEAEAEDDPDAAAISEAGEEIGRLGRNYERLLGWSLRHRLALLGIAVVVLIASGVVASGMKMQFLSTTQTESFLISFDLPPGSSIQRTDALSRQAEGLIQADPDVVAVQESVGGTGTPERGSLTVRTRDEKTAQVVRERVRSQLAFLPNLIFSTPTYSGMGGTGVTGRSIQINIRSALSATQLAPIAAQIEALARSTPGVVDIGSTSQTGRPEVQFFVDPTRASQLGITSNDLASSVRALINGDTATTLRQGTEAIDIVVRLQEDQRRSPADLASIRLPSARGGVPIDSVARVQVGTSMTSLRRTDLQNEIVIGANIGASYTQSDLQKVLQAGIDQLNYPRDQVTISFGGAMQNMTQGFSSLFIAMGLSVLFVYMVLASQFGSFSQPIVIMLAMPFSFIGAFVSLRLANLPLDITGMIGLIMLMGLVVKNSILLVDFTNKLRASGLDKNQAIARAGAIRLRPILMTSAAIIAGAVPTALGIHFFSSGAGSEFRRSLAVVLIGGMLTSTLLTLVVVPTAYSVLESITERSGRIFRRRKPAPTPTPVEAEASAVAPATPSALTPMTPSGSTPSAGSTTTD